MKNVAFVVSHLGSGSDGLVASLNENPRVTIHNSQSEYDHPDSLNWMFERGHKLRSMAAVYGDHLLFNMNFTGTSLYRFCKFIYLIRSARPSLNEIVRVGYTPDRALLYYCFRLRRIYEMARKTPDAIFLCGDELINSLQLIEEYLNLKEPLKPILLTENDTDKTSTELVDKGQECYERYLYRIRQLNLRTTCHS